MSRPPDLAFVACIEAGVLERQAVLLFESIRTYGGVFVGCPIYALAPRAGLGVRRATRDRLDALGVEYIDKVLNTECVEYGSGNRVVAAAHIEDTTAHELLVVLDSDTLVLREPEAFLLAADIDVAVRPVDYKGICTSGSTDPFDGYWRKLCETCSVSYDVIPWIQSYVDDVRCKASYNGGLVVARRDRGILRRWADFFLASVRAGLQPRAEPVAFRSSTGAVTARASKMWGSNQAALSLAMWTTTRRVLTLEPTYNYPLHAHNALGERRAKDFNQLVHVHYHWLFEPDAIADASITAPTSTLAAEKLAWLRARTPFPIEARCGVAKTRARFRDQERHVARPRPSDWSWSNLLAPVAWMSSLQRPVVVVGMHRSGTSLTTAILHSSGLHLGERLMPGTRANAEGYLEDLEFVGLHRAALDALGYHPEGWDEVVLDVMPDPLEAQARALIGARSSRPLWGWKDPRTTLFLPFWERLLPEARFVFVYRKPWEVIDSLYRRGDDKFRDDPAAAARVWSHYNSVILDALSRIGGRGILFDLDDVVAHPNLFVDHVSSAFGLQLRPPGDVFRPHLLRRGTSLADWRALSESILSREIGLVRRLDEAAHRLATHPPATERAEPRVGPEDALLREWAALRAAERARDERRASRAPARMEADLQLRATGQGTSSEWASRLSRLVLDPWRRFRSAVGALRRRWAFSISVSDSDLTCLAETPLFDADFYLATYPDVRAAQLEPRMHYLSRGAAEHRDPSPWFSTAFYLATYPDVAAAGVNPLVHYVTHGAREGRLPCPPFGPHAHPNSRADALHSEGRSVPAENRDEGG